MVSTCMDFKLRVWKDWGVCKDDWRKDTVDLGLKHLKEDYCWGVISRGEGCNMYKANQKLKCNL